MSLFNDNLYICSWASGSFFHNLKSKEMTRKLMNNLSVDCVVFGFDGEQLNVLLVERTLISPETQEVIFSDLTLTGYHIYEDEDLDSAAARIVKDLTGLENIVLEQFYSFWG